MVDVEKLRTIVWLLVVLLVTGFGMALSEKSLHAGFSVLHKLAAVVCFVFIILRAPTTIRLFESHPAILTFVMIFVIAFLAACVTGSIQSIPSQASPVWLNLHRTAWITALIACGVAGHMIATTRR